MRKTSHRRGGAGGSGTPRRCRAGGVYVAAMLVALAQAMISAPPAAADPAPGSWQATAGLMNTARRFHTATRLDGPACRTQFPASYCGDVLVISGLDAELYDRTTDSWTVLPRPASTSVFRRFHTATLLDPPMCRAATPPPGYPCGKVLVVGGRGAPGMWLTAELFDPAATTAETRWMPTARLDACAPSPSCIGRSEHGAALLKDGRVLVVGGEVVDVDAGPSAAQLFDPMLVGPTGVKGSWTPAASMNQKFAAPMSVVGLDGPACRGALPPLHCGAVLVGGFGALIPSEQKFELYHPTGRSAGGEGSWSLTPAHSPWAAPSVLLDPPACHSANPPADYPCGQVLVTGDQPGFFDPWDDSGGSWRRTSLMAVDSGFYASATLTPDGRVLVAGGNVAPTNAELFDPTAPGSYPDPITHQSTPTQGAWSPATPLNVCTPASASCTGRSDHMATLLGDGQVLLAGGIGSTGVSSRSSQRFQPNPAVSIAGAEPAEGNPASPGMARFAVSVWPAPSTTLTVSYTTAAETATAGLDYQTRSGTLSFVPGGPTTTTVEVPLVSDTKAEARESFLMLLTTTSGAAIADGFARATIADDDAPPTITVSDASIEEGDAGAGRQAVFKVSLSTPWPWALSVGAATSNGTARAPGDYERISTQLRFAPGETQKTLAVPVASDTALEPEEDFLVELSAPSAGIVVDPRGIGTIVDDDATPLVSITDGTVVEGNTVASFIVTLNEPHGQEVRVSYATTDDTAQAGSDYQATSGTVVFAPGETRKSVLVTVIADVAIEPAEHFFVDLTGSSGAIISPRPPRPPSTQQPTKLSPANWGVGTITNDDG